jgi:hypothetical protein
MHGLANAKRTKMPLKNVQRDTNMSLSFAVFVYGVHSFVGNFLTLKKIN